MRLEPGATYGRLMVVKQLCEGHPNMTRWLTACECGARHEVLGASLTGGLTKSCGCLRADAAALMGKANLKHGHQRRPGGKRQTTKAYRAWSSAKQRTCNPRHPQWHRYGGRGIAMCRRWINSYEAFLADMGEPPGPSFTLERIDVNKGYSPANCTWIHKSQQSRNRRCSLRLWGIPLVAWAEGLGLSWNTVKTRLRRGWSPAQAVGVPVGTKRKDWPGTNKAELYEKAFDRN